MQLSEKVFCNFLVSNFKLDKAWHGLKRTFIIR